MHSAITLAQQVVLLFIFIHWYIYTQTFVGASCCSNNRDVPRTVAILQVVILLACIVCVLVELINDLNKKL
jgi:Na+/proline symporter